MKRAGSLAISILGLLVVAAFAGPVGIFPGAAALPGTIESDIATLYRKVRECQWNDSQPILQLFSWYGHEIGKYQTDVHFNFVGGPFEQSLRSVGVPDDNMFVTSFVLEAVFETLDLAGDIVTPDRWSVAAAVNATVGLRDKNLPDGVPIFGFWPQKMRPALNASLPLTWEQWPINLAGFSKFIVDEPELMEALVNFVFGPKAWTEYGWEIIDFFKGLETLFEIPSDADDSGVVMALSRHIRNHAAAFPEAKTIWDGMNFNMSLAFELYDKYSYCIASNVSDKNLIDPRTYFWARPYLNNLTDPDACIVTTWMQNTSTMIDIVTNRSAGPVMPLNINNLDPTVGANSIYAMSTSLLEGEADWFTSSSQRRQLYLETAKFVAYAVRTQQTQKRPDLELLYYPPVYNIVWFAARHLNMLQSTSSPLPYPEMEEVKQLLARALYEGGTGYLVDEMIFGAACGTNDSAAICWNGFLGQADTDANGTATPHYDDRYANSAVAALGLIDAFTVRVPVANSSNGNGTQRWTLEWVDAAPEVAKTAIPGVVRYLRAALHDPATGFANAFFSGSGKYWEQYPFWYPANVRYNAKTNATVNCSGTDPEVIRSFVYYSVFGQSGKLDDAEFESLAEQGCMGIAAPTWFSGYNGIKGVKPGAGGIKTAWPYWSSPVLSYALAMQVLAKARALNITG